MKYAWIKDQTGHSVQRLCQVLGVSPSGYYAWRDRPLSARVVEDCRLLQRIEQIHQQNREAYGSDRLWHALRQAGETCGRHRVRRLRCEHNIRTQRRRRYLRARSPYQREMAAPNLLAWPFGSPGRDHVWVADITYLPTQQGWLYLAIVLDMYSRRVVGWAMSDRPQQELASAALAMALTHRQPAAGTIHHSDQGVQYTCKAYRQQLAQAGLTASMSRKGMPYDNAVMESFFSSLKQELTHHERFKTRDEGRSKVFDYIEVFYNRQRLHSSLDYRSPAAFEQLDCVA
jgi:putative transposase